MFFCGSFTKPVRLTIKERANEKSELSGENSRPLVCAHLRHRGGRRGRFDRPENGLLVTDIEHFAHHKLFKDNPERIGLSTDQNDLSILTLTRTIKTYNKEHRITDEETQEKYENAVESWIGLFDSNHRILGVSKNQNDEIITDIIRSINRDGD